MLHLSNIDYLHCNDFAIFFNKLISYSCHEKVSQNHLSLFLIFI